MNELQQLERFVRSVVETFTYKPDWIFAVGGDADVFFPRKVVVVLNRLLPLVENPEERSWIGSMRAVPSEVFGDIPAMQEFLFGIIDDAEDHERDEWLKFNGVHYRDPHPELRTRPSGETGQTQEA